MKIKERYPRLFEAIDRGDSVIFYIAKFREFGLRVVEENDKLREGVFDQVYFCPFTGELLPESLRDVWFDKLDDLKLDPQSPNIPEEMQTDKWWLSET